MAIRPFRRGDGPAFVSLVRALARYERLAPPGPAASARLVRDAGRRFEALLGFVDGRPAGYAIWFPAYSSFLARPTLWLEDLFILPAYRRLGLGRLMYARLKRHAERSGFGRLEWIVLGWNRPAHRFYRRLGAAPLRGWVPYRVALRRRAGG